jgi:hypothetical protein
VKVLIGINEVLKTFEGEAVQDGDPAKGPTKPLTIKRALTNYIINCNLMGTTGIEQAIAYDIGILMQSSKYNDLAITQGQYDLIKRLVDNNKVKEESFYSCLVNQQLKRLIDNAENVPDKEEKPKK